MKVILVFASTLDGKITKWGNPMVKSWASESDKQYFKQLWNNNKLILMGSSTFDADPLKPTSKSLLVVMTQRVSDYKNYEVPGKLEFSNESPTQLAIRFEEDGYEQMMVVGGAHIATSFFKEQLINELWLTIEPKIFGTGGNFVIEEELDINLRLISCEKVNDEGTLITRYAVLKQ